MFIRLGFLDAAATSIAQEQELTDLDELHRFTNKEVINLCKAASKPGGRIQDPNNPGQWIDNPGEPRLPWSSTAIAEF